MPEANMESRLELRDILSLLRRQTRVILGTMILVLTGTGLVLLSLQPIYSATAMVIVDPTRKDILDPLSQASSLSSDSARVDGEVELIKTDPNLLGIISATNLLQSEEFGVQPGVVDRLAALFKLDAPDSPDGEAQVQQVKKRLDAAIDVRRLGLTYLIAVEARSRDPVMAAQLANAAAQGYIDLQLQAKVEAVLASRDLLQGRIETARAALVEAEQSVDGAISGNLAKIVAETGRSDLQSLSRLLDQRSSEQATLLSTISSAEGLQRGAEWSRLADTLQDEATRLLARQRAALLEAEAVEPDNAQVRERLAEIDRQLAERVDRQIGTLRSRVADLAAEASATRTELRTAVLSSDLPADVLTGIFQLQQSAELARTQYQTILSRLAELDGQAYLQVADSRIVAEAVPPSDPSFPRPTLTLALAGLFSLGLGIGLGFLRDNFIGGFTTGEQLQALLGTDQVALIPYRRASRERLADDVVSAPLSEFAESHRRLRLQIEHLTGRNERLKDEPPAATAILVTSFAPGEGKTSTALALARTFALSGKRTLLIDCDLRRPALHIQLDAREAPAGLVDALKASNSDFNPSEFSRADRMTPLRVVFAGRSDGGPTDVLSGGQALAELIRNARFKFDAVILDAPPLGPVVDALYLARHVDVALFVVKWADTRQQDVRTAVRSLAQVMPDHGHILPVLAQERFSGADRRRYAGYYTS